MRVDVKGLSINRTVVTRTSNAGQYPVVLKCQVAGSVVKSGGW
jgi:hypothetical protein